MKRVELLAPAGNTECALAAINAGADALYMGATRFSARAYADNLADDDLIHVIRLAHLHGTAVYLTLNTLLNSGECQDVPGLLAPLYAAGLDGVIVQDMGVAEIISRNFPGLPLHASTQMSIMNQEGADYFGRRGFTRIVPARELTLEEVRIIKEQTGLELECFIHGAMCYSYSGLCLMSSIIGGRSGNRGKCAGTCRLPFKFEYKDFRVRDEAYPLSMKDLCTLDIIPQLIEAGIDSFKIEGRMKSPEYVAGVTSIYRKYIDLYYEKGNGVRVSKEDIRRLNSLYIRSEISHGYYMGDSGARLITMNRPGYNGNDERLVDSIHSEFVHEPSKIPVEICCDLHTGLPAKIRMKAGEISFSVEGRAVEKALNQPLSAERVKKQLDRLGDTPFEAKNITADVSADAFMVMGQLNELRREAAAGLEDAVISSKGFIPGRTLCDDALVTKKSLPEKAVKNNGAVKNTYDIQVLTPEQLCAVLDYNRNYGGIDRITVDRRLLLDNSISGRLAGECSDTEVYVSLPGVYRQIHRDVFEKTAKAISENTVISGVLVHTFDELAWAEKLPGSPCICTDTSVYMHNPFSVDFISADGSVNEITMPYELQLSEMYPVVKAASECGIRSSVVVYGKIPLMYTAGCLKKTYGCCDCRSDIYAAGRLTDRYDHDFTVYTDCDICTNVIYNDRPLSLFRMMDRILKLGCGHMRICFTEETAEETEEVLKGFIGHDAGAVKYLNGLESTTGHLKHGV